MLVKFQAPWFSPTEKEVIDKIRHTSGRRYKKGVHEIPNALRPFLPRTAVVLDKESEPEVVEEKVEETLKDFDQDRAASDDLISAEEKAEQERLEKKRANMAKAREAAAKKKAEKANKE